jgi:hypothetical protein
MAATLHNSPTEIYSFVRENFEFEPYLGSRKGSQQTLDHRRGNDYDQASLLIALLRVSGIPARYATNTIEMPIEQATNWLGIDDPVNAGSILTTAGMQGVLVYMGPDPVAIRCRRVWVEAWIPFINYRGATNDSTGFIWVPLDPTFKQYSYKAGINLPAEMGFNAESFVEEYYSSFHTQTPAEMFKQRLLDSLSVRHPGAVYEDLLTTRSVIKETDGILPGTLPYELIAQDSIFSAIPSDKRYRVQFYLHDDFGMVLDYSTTLPEIVGKQVTISYVGATPSDQYIIDTAGGIFNVQHPYLVDLKPVLKIDGCEVVRASGEIMMGRTHYSDMHFTTPTGAQNQMPTVSNTIIAGNYQGIGLDTEDAFPAFFDIPQTACEEEYLGQEVHQTALTYLNNVDVADDEVASLAHIVVMNDVSEAIVENTVRVLFSGGLPLTFEWTGMIVDADRKIIGPFSFDGIENDCDYMRLSGADGSIQENRLFETRFEEEAISAIKILELASDSGIAICKITYSIAAECPGISQPSSVISAINSALAQGHHVIIPRRGFTYYNWTGTGWIDIDPTTCAAGYIISGGQNGGATVQDWSAELEAMLTSKTICIQPSGTITVTPAPDAGTDLYCAQNTSNWEFTVPSIKGYDEKCKVTTTIPNKKFKVTNYTIKKLADDSRFGPGEYTFIIGSPSDPYSCGCTILEKKVIIYKLTPMLKPKDDFASRSYKKYGLAEIIDIDFKCEPSYTAAQLGGLKWFIEAGGGTVIGGTDGKGTFTAGETPENVNLKLKVQSGNCQGNGPDTNLTIVAPSGAYMVQAPGTGIWHTQNTASVGFKGHPYLEPKDVSFKNIEFREGTCTATASGFYAYQNGDVHPVGIWVSVGSGNSTTGCRVLGEDQVQSAPKGPPYSVGDFNWPIPWEYRVAAGSATQCYTANHHKYADATGKCCIEKAGAGPFCKNAADPTSGY